jgi:hypothetical protein
MSDYDVTPHRGGGWQAKREGAKQASSVHRTQAEAQRAATDYAQSTGGGEVRIHRPTGEIRNSNTIDKHDPNPPKDRKH